MKLLILPFTLLFLACSSGSQVNIHSGKMIVPGRGTDEMHVGMNKTEILDLLGAPESVSDDGRVLSYQKTYKLEVRLDNLSSVAEIGFGQEFRGRLPSRVQIGSKTLEVFKAYGSPAGQKEISSGSEGTEDRVLYQRPDGYRITYSRLGLGFWFSPAKRVIRIIVFKPFPDRGIRIKPEDTGE